MLKVDGVFAGGGIKAFSFVGALRTLQQENISFQRLAGTSAGSIIAAFIQAGYTCDEIEKILDDLDLMEILHPKEKGKFISRIYKWMKLYRKMGLYQGEYLERWLKKVLKQKGVTTFGDLPPGVLKMIASDITNGELIVIPDDLPKYGIIPETFSIAKAIRISCSLPFLFEPVKLPNRNGKRSILLDGGILSNFPIWLFTKNGQHKQQRPLLGFRLSPSEDTFSQREIKNAFSMLQATVETMWKAHDQRYISKLQAKNIVFIPVENISATEFSISNEEKNHLIELGEKSTKEFLKKWSY